MHIKYSIIMPYYNRESLNITLLGFSILYSNRSDYEIIIIEDLKNVNNTIYHDTLLNIINSYKLPIRLIPNDLNTYNPARAFNLGVQESSGENIILTNPECTHISNILDYLDNNFNKNNYYVFACLLVECLNIKEKDFNRVDFKSKEFWYQHTQYRNEKYHFCSCISKELYNKIKGFDENYCKTGGIGYEDNDFVMNISQNNIPIITIDNPYVYHIKHDTNYQLQNLLEVNKQYFDTKWKK